MEEVKLFEKDIEQALTGKGTRQLSLGEALSFLDFLTERGWAIQSMEAFEVKDGKSYPDFRYAILGLTKAELSPKSAKDLYNIAKNTFTKANNDTGKIEFIVWIDRPENILKSIEY